MVYCSSMTMSGLIVAWLTRDTIQRLGWETLFDPHYSPEWRQHIIHSLDNHLCEKFIANEADMRQVFTDVFASKTPELY